MEVQVRAVSSSYTSQLRGTLGALVRNLQTSLEGAQEGEGRKIGELTQQAIRVDQLRDKSKKLR